MFRKLIFMCFLFNAINVCAEGISIRSYNEESTRYALFKEFDESGILTLSQKGNVNSVKTAISYMKIEPVAISQWRKLKKTRTGWRYIYASIASKEAIIRDAKKEDFSFLWSDNGNAVALLFKSNPIAFVTMGEKYGFSKAVNRKNSIVNPWNQRFYETIFNKKTIVTSVKPTSKAKIPSQVYKSYYKNKKIKYFYKTHDGKRLNPTNEYYNDGDLKQKWVYEENLLKSPLKLNKIITVTNISIIKEHRDTLTFGVTYHYHKNNKSTVKKPWLYISLGPRDYFINKAMPLSPGRHSAELTRTVSLKAPIKFDTFDLTIKYHESNTDEWLTLDRIDLIKIWGRNI